MFNCSLRAGTAGHCPEKESIVKDQDLSFVVEIAKHRLRIREKIKNVVTDAFVLAAKFAQSPNDIYDIADLGELVLSVVDGNLPRLPKRDLVNIVSRICALDFGRGGRPLSPEILAVVEAELRAA
jgi:hypothetical protein